MIERKEKRYVSCPVCGRILMKCYGKCDIEINCCKCGGEIVAIIDEDRVMVLENRRETIKRGGQVKVSVRKERREVAC